MMAALQQNLRPAQRERLFDLPVQLIQSNHVGVVVLLRAVEGAELAIDVADVGVVDVAVNDVGDDVVAAAVEVLGLCELAAAVGERAEFFEWQMIKPQGLVLIDTFALPNLLQQLVQ